MTKSRRKRRPKEAEGISELGLMFQKAPDAIIVADVRSGVIMDLNQVAERVLGARRDELLGRHYTRLHPKDAVQAVREIFRRHVRHGGGPDELEFMRPDGRRVPVDMSTSVVMHKGRKLLIGVFRDISRRRRQEEMIRASEQHFRQLADSITDVFFEMDRNLRYTYWNKASEELTGIAARDAIGKSLLEVFPDTPDIRRSVRVYRNVLRTQRSQRFVNHFAMPDPRFLEISVYPSVTGLAVFVRDITAARKLAQALQDSEERYRTMIANAPVVAFTLDRHGVFTLSEGKGLAKLGLKAGQVVGRSALEIYKDYPVILRSLKAALAGKAVRCETCLNGSVFDASYTPVHDASGRVTKVIGLADDITERKLSEDAIAYERNLYVDLVHSLPAGVYRLRVRQQKAWGTREWVGKVETEYHLEMVSDLFCRYLGVTREALQANAALVVQSLHPDDRDGFVRRNVMALENLKPFEWEGRVINHDRLRWVRFLSVARCLPDGDVLWTGVLQDVTERKEAEEVLRRSHDDLEFKVRERTERLRLLAAELTGAEHRERRRISHVLHEDLQQRLVALQYKIQSLREAERNRSSIRLEDRVLRELRQAVQLTRTLAVRMAPPVLYDFGLRAALDWLARDAQSQLGLSIRVLGLRSFEFASDDCKGFAFDCVRELLLNVRKHAGVAEAEIRIKSEGKGRIAIEVRDRGRGCAGIHRKRRDFGLFSVRERALAMGGDFTVTSEIGKGTCARLILPVR